ncbi:MAG: histidine phosphatase family protein [Sulfurimonas sp.]|nr:histidine phosphatase family protein [Sulfurimonas sp.]
MKITLVRHGEVEEKYIGCYNGHIDIGLSEKGYADAKELANHFSASDFDAIFCSNLKRTKETIKQFIEIDKIIYTKELREKSWGEHEGMYFEQIISNTRLSYLNFEQWINALGGERPQEFISRVEKFFLDFLPQIEKENILVVTHSGVIKTLIHLLQDISLEEAFSTRLPYASYVVYNSETKKLDVHD